MYNIKQGILFKNCHKIHPLQQKKVQEMINDAMAFPQVCRIYIFGSSVTDNCHTGSDIDIYYELSEPIEGEAYKMPVSRWHDFEYDAWNNYMVDARLYSEIIKTGVIVYDIA